MASAVDICNLALAHLGDEATVASINPPEGSAQAEHCARFYPLARDSLLELHEWGFATRTVQLAQLSGSRWGWQYAYAQPAGTIKLIGVIPPSAASSLDLKGKSQPYSRESDTNGGTIILTDQPNALARYIALVEDTTKFTPLFTQTLTWHLAAMLAGPVLKGDAGATAAQHCTGVMSAWLSQAKTSDANQRKVKQDHTPDWLQGRGVAINGPAGWGR